MLGPAAPVGGGMAAVVDLLASSALGDDFDLRLLNTGKLTSADRSWQTAVRSQLRLVIRFAVMLLRGYGRIVHIHTCSGLAFWRDSLFLVLAWLFRRKVIWHIHGGGFVAFIEGMKHVHRIFLRLAFSRSDAVIVLSETWRMRLSQRLQPPRWVVIENGVRLPPARSEDARTNAFLFVGTLDKAKGADDLIVATAIAARKKFYSRVLIAGPETAPGQRARLCGMIEREALSDRITLLGIISGQSKTQAFATAGTFVLPSHVEALPMAMLEAMAHGLPVIVTDVGAIREVVNDEIEGFIVRPGDPDSLADRMIRLGNDAGLRARMGAAARRCVEGRYTVDSMAARTAALYHDILSAVGRSAMASQSV